jgi:drug/metabolite transporter (DMT)-like permease
MMPGLPRPGPQRSRFRPVLPDGQNRLAFPVLLTGAALIAASPIFVRVSELGPTATAFHRTFLALPLLFAWVATDRGATPGDRTRRPPRRRDMALLVVAGAFFAGDLFCWHWAITLTSVANATLFANFAPLFVALGAWLILRERVPPVFFVALAIALAGTVMIVGADFSLDPRNVIGDAVGLVTAAFWGAYQLTVKRLRRSFSTASVMAWTSLATSAFLLPMALLSGDEMLAASASGWLILLGLAALSHAGGHGAIAYALAHLPASFSSLAILVEPVVAAGLAWMLLAEPLGPLQAAGGALVLSSILVAHRMIGRTAAPVPDRGPTSDRTP